MSTGWQTTMRSRALEDVIRKAGLRDTYFPASPRIRGPHSKAYESMYGLIDPPRDYSVYDMSWGGMAGAPQRLTTSLDDRRPGAPSASPVYPHTPIVASLG